MRKKVFSCICILMIMTPLSFSGIAKVTDYKMDVELGGYSTEIEEVDFSLPLYMNGEFQDKFETWWENSFKPRSVIVRSYNELRYQLFNIGNCIVGKENVLFEQDYILEYLCIGTENDFSNIENQLKANNYVNDIVELDKKLTDLGKKLIVYTTPNKCNFFDENIPEKYRILSMLEETDGTRAIDYLSECLRKEEILFIDGGELLKEMEYPVFYKTGIHCSRTAEQYLHSFILKTIEEKYEVEIKKFSLLDVNKSETPFWRDTDLLEIMNVWSQSDELYYEYTVGTSRSFLYKPLGYLIQGGSFADGLRKDLADEQISDRINYINYNNYWLDKNGYYHELSLNNNALLLESDWSNLDIGQILSETDVVIIELNEKHIKYFSNGFVKYLNDYLDTYSIMEKYSVIKNWTAYGNYAQELDNLYGIYAYEDGFAWGKKYCSVELQNEYISQNGLEIELEIPGYWDFSDGCTKDISIYVNGKYCSKIYAFEPGKQTIKITPEALYSEDSIYSIEIYSPESFVPSELNINGDNRELSIILRYIGEVR